MRIKLVSLKGHMGYALSLGFITYRQLGTRPKFIADKILLATHLYRLGS